LREVYGDYLDEQFGLAHESEYWTLYVRRRPVPQSIVAR
jgi:hypothetical protein